ncbi:hypothetical protein GCM10007906_37900 [Vibrio hyugaensis]|uniref:Uncharacterized protein n=1 Tax=Vibrio hyugaensis TaxID=1534743 RepID=A0ABQ5Y5E4_9VIBR|nr:hypothetical protein GCM10007906_37900 [Vibrio hyugaensis]
MYILTASRFAAEKEVGGAAITALESANRNKENRYFMIKVFIKYDFIHSNTQKLALVMSVLTIMGKKKPFENDNLCFRNLNISIEES